MQSDDQQADGKRQQHDGGDGSGGGLGYHRVIPAALILRHHNRPAGGHGDKYVDQENIQRIDHIDGAHRRYPGGADHGGIHQVQADDKRLVDQNRENECDNLPVINRLAGEMPIQKAMR
ncbi:hypothetical protein HMSSN139_09920 [Paenibacillus sp. HMSSN-139]|nr:hypothetical protein HMSSN139_09920 [Paenibacillus sp. HMSSN-139]